MFKDMAADTYLASAGIADDWSVVCGNSYLRLLDGVEGTSLTACFPHRPYGRGCWQSDDKQCIVWFGEEDQLYLQCGNRRVDLVSCGSPRRRIMCMKRGTNLNEVFDRLKKMLDTIESIDGIDFATSDATSFIFSS